MRYIYYQCWLHGGCGSVAGAGPGPGPSPAPLCRQGLRVVCQEVGLHYRFGEREREREREDRYRIDGNTVAIYLEHLE